MATASSDEAPRIRLDAFMVTDVGVVRDHNEDAAHIDGRRSFFVVADGMGGHAAGEVASAMAVDTVRTSLETARPSIEAFAKAPSDTGRRDLVQLLQNAVLSAHQAVYQRGSRESDKQGMGTTLDVVLIAGPEAFVAHVGDSRTYLIRDGRCAQITTDHTVAEVLVIEGKLSIEEAQVSPLRTILVNAIGVSADVGVEMAHLQLRPGDRLLLCSDGLHDYFVVEQEIADKLSGTDPNGALGEMVEMAKERGGHDNITGVIVNVLEVATGSEAVPAEIEHDETMPVDVSRPNPSSSNEWSDDEETQNLSPKDIADKADAAAASAGTKRDLETDVTMEAPAVSSADARGDGPGKRPGDRPESPDTGKPGEPATDYKRTTPMRVVRHITNPAASADAEAKVEPDPPVDAPPEPPAKSAAQPTDADKPADARPADAGKPADTRPAGAGKPADTDKPTGAGKPADAKPAGTDKPTGAGKPADAKPADTDKPADAATPDDDARRGGKPSGGDRT